MLYYKKKKSKKKHIITILLLILVMIISSFVPNSNNIVSNVVSYVTVPLAEITSVITNGIRSIIDFSIGTKPNREMVNKLNIENQELRKEINELKYIVSKSDYLEESYNFLKNNNDALKANVVMLDNDEFFKQFIVNKGSNHGVEVGDIVLNSYSDSSKNVNGALVGKVISVNDNSSVVSSILDEKYSITFEDIATSTIGIINERTNGILQGYLLEKIDIKNGQMIYTSGTGGRYSKGIYIGNVVSVEESDDRLRTIVKVKSPVNFSKINEVFIVPNEER